MPSVAVNIPITQIANIINTMSTSELETLLIEMDTKQSNELKNRFKSLCGEIEMKNTLTIEDVFDV